MTKRVVTAHVPADLAKRIDGLADRLDRRRGWVVKETLEAYVGLAEERHRETLAALRDVDSGGLVEHDEVESWLTGLGGARRGKGRSKAIGWAAVALRWTLGAFADLRRIHEFLEPLRPAAASRAVRLAVARVRRMPATPAAPFRRTRVPVAGNATLRANYFARVAP